MNTEYQNLETEEQIATVLTSGKLTPEELKTLNNIAEMARDTRIKEMELRFEQQRYFLREITSTIGIIVVIGLLTGYIHS